MSNDPTVPPTQPTLETILERINALDQSLRAGIAQVRSDLSADLAKVRSDLSGEIQSFREEVLESFSKVNSKFDVLNNDLLELRAEQRRHGKRLDELERKAS
ncbi:MAG: hypothetical protein ACJ74J_16235 [Blastocatellia bacterium]